VHGDVARQQIGEDLVLVGLVFVGGAAVAVAGALEYRRNDLLGGRELRDHRLEAREEQRADVEGAVLEQPQNLVADLLGMLERKRAHAQFEVLDDLPLVLPAQLLVALAADAEELDLLALAHERVWAL